MLYSEQKLSNVDYLKCCPVLPLTAITNYFCRFPCHFLTFALLLQVTWIYETNEGDRTNIAVFHPSFQPNYPNSPLKGRVSFSPSPPAINSPSIQIRDVRMNDEGKYICEYATYPSGSEQGITQLVMLGKSLIMFLHFSN